MGHLKSTELPESLVHPADFDREPRQSGGRAWIWILALVVVLGATYWYFHSEKGGAAVAALGGAAGGHGGRPGGPGEGNPDQVVPVVVSTATRGDLPVFFNGLGTVTAYNTVTIRSRVDGQIVKINFTEGQMVREGESLVEIDPRPYQVQLEQAEGQLAKDQAQLRDVQVDYDRYQQLFKAGVIPKQQVDTQQAQVGQFMGSIKADQASIDNAKLQITYSHVTAPISGRVGLRLVDIGNIVHATDTTGLLVITQLQPIAVIFSLPQDQLSQVMGKMHGAGPLPVDAYDRDDTTKIATGRLLTIDNQIDTTTGTYKLKAVFNNDKDTLFPNQFVNIHLLVDTKHNVTIVPATAIARGPQGTYVYLTQKDSRVKIQPVTVTLNSGNSVAIGKGLRAGDTVVIDGQDKLQDGSRIDARTASGAPVNLDAQATGNSDSSSSSPAEGGSTEQQPSKSQAAHKDAER
ncbi:MAG TPA: MdtA/MuxA family multidrug efflux RND transporter periplasmic adaptor subunit [Candidatus Acidoferrum sp.]|nr:MdtA/MuxA family multidrug efflux RND transporter periplasmic adaptor subunit [Candidatus Acidoferrum sp.]